MDLAAKHIDFVLASYAISGLVLIILIGSIVIAERKTRNRLARLEAAGAGRRRKRKSENE